MARPILGTSTTPIRPPHTRPVPTAWARKQPPDLSLARSRARDRDLKLARSGRSVPDRLVDHVSQRLAAGESPDVSNDQL